MNEAITLPAKLTKELNRRTPAQRKALQSLLEAVMTRCPNLKIRSTARYSAIYNRGRIVAIIEPQANRIVFGFFRDHVDQMTKAPVIEPVEFPQWNTSKGGLIGYALDLFGPTLIPIAADLEAIIIEAYQSV